MQKSPDLPRAASGKKPHDGLAKETFFEVLLRGKVLEPVFQWVTDPSAFDTAARQEFMFKPEKGKAEVTEAFQLFRPRRPPRPDRRGTKIQDPSLVAAFSEGCQKRQVKIGTIDDHNGGRPFGKDFFGDFPFQAKEARYRSQDLGHAYEPQLIHGPFDLDT
jgi:hypothetical protein